MKYIVQYREFCRLDLMLHQDRGIAGVIYIENGSRKGFIKCVI